LKLINLSLKFIIVTVKKFIFTFIISVNCLNIKGQLKKVRN